MKHRKQYHHGGNKKRFNKKQNDKPQVSGRSIEVRNGNVNFEIKESIRKNGLSKGSC